MSNLVVVALPAQNDYIWQVSSEKVPHMTLLFLGEDGEAENTQAIVEFVGHAAHGLDPFYMEADYRGTLGPDEADVLFFDQGGSSFKTISEFRSQLLKNAAIKLAYNSVDQFPEWTPHLTLGYPATPATTPDKDRTIYSVEFDRIAVWTSDSDGPEFRLKYEPGRWDAPLSMSAEDAKTLLHYGVKGMHWGQRMAGIKANAAKREEATQASRREKFAPKDVTVKSSLNEKGKRKVKVTGGTHHDLHEDAVAAKSHKQKAAKSGLDSLSNKELQQLANRMNLEQQVRRLSNADPKPSKGFVHDLIVNAGKKKVTDLANDPDNFEKLIKLAMK